MEYRYGAFHPNDRTVLAAIHLHHDMQCVNCFCSSRQQGISKGSSLVKGFVCRASKHLSAGQDRRSHNGKHQDRCVPGWCAV